MFEIFNETEFEIPEITKLEEYMRFIVQKEQLEEYLFNFIFVTNEEIHQINYKYRNVDRVTDVISFALRDGEEDFEHEPVKMLGDVYIAINVAYEQATEYHHSREREVCFLATHGLLHLLGYDHMNKQDEEKMIEKQEELLNAYQIKR